MRTKRALIALLVLLSIVVAAVLVLRPSGSHKPGTAPELSSKSAGEDADERVNFAKHAHVTLIGGRTFAVGRIVRVSAGGSSPLFGQPTIAGVAGEGFEASLRLDPSDPTRMYESVPASLSANTSWVWTSTDGGKSFRWVTDGAPDTGKYSTCAGGGDTELGVDSTGSLYFNDLTLANFSVSRSDDHGTTVTCSNSGVPDAGVDRQWYTIDGDPKAGGAIYLANDEVGPGAPMCGSSDGNNVLVMYRSPVGTATDAGIEFGPSNKVSGIDTCNEGIMGNDELSPVATTTSNSGPPLATPEKHVYVIHDDASFSKILIGRCYPVAITDDPSGLNCLDLPVADLGDPSTVRTGGSFPTMAIDKAGNLYAVWEQAPVANSVVGNASLMFSYSTDEANHWSKPVAIPTGLSNHAFAWIAAGDDGRVDIAFYGTKAKVDTANGGPQGCTTGGDDAVDGFWSIYVTQSLNAHSGTVKFSKPVDAAGHPIHHGSIQTVMGSQCGDRTLGDFFQLRIGSNGEAETSFADSNNLEETFAPHAMFVRQVGGSGLYVGKSPSGPTIHLGSATDVSGDATYNAAGQTSADMPNLDITGSSFTSIKKQKLCHTGGQACYRITMQLADLSLDAPVSPDTDSVLIWQTQWLLPAKPGCDETKATCKNGGRNLMVYAESDSGGALQCWVGENAATPLGGGVALTYPGSTQLMAPGECADVLGPNGTITIDVPVADVGLDPGIKAFSKEVYSVTASTLTAAATPDSVPVTAGFGGVLFNEIDAAPAYNARS